MMNPSVIAKNESKINPDRTSSGKEHFEVLDGLRGSAAILIVILHLFNHSFWLEHCS
jgi:peptidoglycan/LPS O-acetylase OafA/YrhL